MAYVELLQHLASLPETTKPDILLLQETHWSGKTVYVTPGWRVIATGAPSVKSGGVAALVSDNLCSSQDILHTTVIAGRLQHIRILLNECTVDVVNVYQKVHSTSLQAEAGTEPSRTPKVIRKELWSSLSALLRRLPARHILVVAGDLNTPPPQDAQLVGSRVHCSDSGRHPPDLGELHDILREHRLLLLNSWSRHAKCTFHGPHGSTFIDHIYTRHSQADRGARTAGPVVWMSGTSSAGAKAESIFQSLPHLGFLQSGTFKNPLVPPGPSLTLLASFRRVATLTIPRPGDYSR